MSAAPGTLEEELAVIRIAIIAGTTRPNRKSLDVANWVLKRGLDRLDAEFEVVDLADFDLPLYDEPLPPMSGRYAHAHTTRWSQVISGFDGFVFVTGEYNHSMPASLKNAVDYLFHEWNNKSAGFVTYGTSGGHRAAEAMRLVMGELMVADVRSSVALSVFTDFENHTTFSPAASHDRSLNAMLDQVVSWAGALAPLRGGR
jgi:NAD(P)H-dependent FMN reductase